LKLTLQASSYSLALELYVLQLLVFGTSQKDSLIIIINIHFIRFCKWIKLVSLKSRYTSHNYFLLLLVGFAD